MLTFEDKPPSPDRVARGDMVSYVLLFVAMVSLGFASERWVLVAPLLVALGLHPLYGERWQISLSAIGYLTMALPLAILSREWQAEGRHNIVPLNEMFYLSLYLMLVALLKLYSKPDHDRSSRVLFCSSLTLGMMGAHVEETPYAVMTAVYAVAVVIALRLSLRSRAHSRESSAARTKAILAACVCTMLAWTAIALPIRAHYHAISGLFYRWMIPRQLASSAGFTDQASLGSVSEVRSEGTREEIAVRVFSADKPGYLRGRVFAVYGAGQWAPGAQDNELIVDRGGERDRPTGRVLVRGVPERLYPEAFQEPQLQAFPDSRYKAHFFLPLKTTALETASERVMLCPGNTFKAKFKGSHCGYGVFVEPGMTVYDSIEALDGRVPAATQNAVDRRLVENGIPPSDRMHEALVKKINEIHRLGCGPLPGPYPACLAASAAVKVKAIRDYFAAEYTYRIGINLHATSPLWDFLENKRHGHCELFASAGVMLLRKMDVPARYVTGFVCEEKNPYTDLWVARNKHAHAWVEYFEPDRGWQTAEFTPGGGLPQINDPSGMDALLGYLSALWRKFVAFFQREGVMGLLRYVLTIIGTAGNWVLERWWRILLAALLLGLFFYYRLFRGRRTGQKRIRVPREFPPGLALQREKFLQLEKDLARRRLGRQEAETLTEYAERLAHADFDDRDAVVRFIQQYADARYAPFSS